MKKQDSLKIIIVQNEAGLMITLETAIYRDRTRFIALHERYWILSKTLYLAHHLIKLKIA